MTTITYTEAVPFVVTVPSMPIVGNISAVFNFTGTGITTGSNSAFLTALGIYNQSIPEGDSKPDLGDVVAQDDKKDEEAVVEEVVVKPSKKKRY
jgi:hypothetical protein